MKYHSLILFLCSLFLFAETPLTASETYNYDIVVYGGTSSAVIAAVQAAKMDKSVVIVSPARRLGGMSSGGLGWSDTGNTSVIGGLSRKFYHRIWQHYQQDSAWVWQDKEDYGNQGQGSPAIDGDERTMWIFEPHAANSVFEGFIADYNIPVHRDQWLNRENGVRKDGAEIISIETLSGRTYYGKMFIDATYEGDLMAAAGVSYTVGREANSVYNENWNGVQTGVFHHSHNFNSLSEPVSPYVIPNDPASGLLPRISSEPLGEKGEGDNRVQAYCYRMCLTTVDENRIPFPKPENYDPNQYELMLRVFDTGWREAFNKFPQPYGCGIYRNRLCLSAVGG